MENNEKDKLSFSGFPLNDEIELPDVESKGSRSSFGADKEMINAAKEKLKNLDFKSFKSMLPESLLNNLLSSGGDEEDLEEAFNIAMGIVLGDTDGDESDIDKILDSLSLGDLFDEGDFGEDEDDVSQDSDNLLRFNLGSIDRLAEQPFGNILVRPLQDGDIQYFQQNYKSMPVSMFNETLSRVPDITDRNLIDRLDFVFSSDDSSYAIFKAIPTNQDAEPYYIIGVREYSPDTEPSEELNLYVPSFMNPINLSNDGNSARLFNKNDDPAFFDAKGTFFPFNMLGLIMGIESMVVPYRKVLMSPALFGNFKPVKESITSSSEWLRIGNLISNESAEAILLKKDADLDLEETKFPFYVKFDCVHERESLQYLQDILFKINLESTALMYFSELKFKNGRLYIDLDLGEF